MVNKKVIISEEKFDPKKHVKEYKRKCNECGKVWHALANREEKLKKAAKTTRCNSMYCYSCGGGMCSMCGSPAARQVAKKSAHDYTSELDRMRMCPNCGSNNYTEEVLIYEKEK